MTSCVSLLLLSCSPEKLEKQKPAPLLPAELTLAHTHIEANRPDLALAILAHQPEHPETIRLLGSMSWHLPTTLIEHPGFEIHHIAMHGESLWVAVEKPPLHTIIRWNLESLDLAATLFPTRDPLHAFVISPTGTHAVVTRGEVSLLIDAQTLKPIADLGEIPADITPESAIAYNRDSLLVAHPTASAWHIRDTATGEIIRSISLDEMPASSVLAAHLDTQRLRLLTTHGTRIDIPVSPVEPLTVHPFDEEPLEILHAHFIDHGDTAIIIRHLGPHKPPVAIEFDLVEINSPSDFDIDAWASRQSHTPLPGLATGLLRHLAPPPVELTDTAIIFHRHPQAPLLSPHPTQKTTLIAYTADPTSPSLATAESSGLVTIHHQFEIPENPTTDILTILARHPYHRDTATIRSWDLQSHGGWGLQPQGGWDLQSQSVEGTSCPLKSLKSLHQRLTNALHSPEDSPAHQLSKALTDSNPEKITTLLESAENLPDTLRTLATSQIHLLQGNTAAAFAPYHHGFPDLARIRLREDWHGWEQPDFQPAVDSIRHAYESLIATLTIDPEADEATRHATIARLTNPATLESLGRTRYAAACLDAAKVLTTIAGEAQHAFTLATLARHHGAPAVACLRTEALALTALEKFPEAHARWIEIITDHPAAAHLADDYAEAAYTAFENADPRQAIAILITGTHRFGHDPSFALRSGWIALLAGHPAHARAFLLKGHEAGYPLEELEHATALLAASAALVHDTAAAAAHFQDLIALDPAWASPDSLDALAWPDHLKAPLRQLTW